jgi:hypothetical protein
MTHHRSPSDGAQRLARARALLDAYGADRARWPAGDRALFDALIGDPRFEAARQEAAALDAALGAAPADAAGAALKDAILARFPARPAHGSRLQSIIEASMHGFGRLAPLGAAAGLSALGFAIGLASAGASEEDALYYALDTSMIEFAENDSLWAEEL